MKIEESSMSATYSGYRTSSELTTVRARRFRSKRGRFEGDNWRHEGASSTVCTAKPFKRWGMGASAL